MDEKEYHRSRRMFFVINNELVLPEKGSEKSHREWLEDNGYSKDEAEKIKKEPRSFLNIELINKTSPINKNIISKI